MRDMGDMMTDNTNTAVGAASEALDENKLIAERRAKLALLRAEGDAYPNDFRIDAFAAALQDEFADAAQWDVAALEGVGRTVSVAGRMMLRRVQGKVGFVQLQDGSGRIQLFVHAGTVGADVYEQFKGWDVGDIVGASGTLMRTRTGELSVRVETLRLLTKCLRPLPDKWHGLADVEQRYRQRHVDLIVNADTRRVFELRSRIIGHIRRWLEMPGREFMEVETPMMHVIPGGAAARPFVTHHNALDLDLYLRIAPELYLKRLVVGGFERVYEINRSFRNEGVSTRHNPEFTMLELYQAYATHVDIMDLTESMIRDVAQAVLGDPVVEWDGARIDLSAPFVRVRMDDAVLNANPSLQRGQLRDQGAMAAHCASLGIDVKPGSGWGQLLLEIFEATVEEGLTQPTFITAYPVEVSPLARASDAEPDVTDRFELFIHGKEIANGFAELNDPEEQAERFQAQVAAMDAGDEEAMHFDAEYIRALETGLPPTGGLGIGIDRLVMMLTGSSSIRDVLLFPHMRPRS